MLLVQYNCSECATHFTGWCNSCTSDPFSCTNIPKDKQHDGPGTLNQSGLVCAPPTSPLRCANRWLAERCRRERRWEVETVLTQMGGRPCWNLSQYDDFNVRNAQAYYDWAVRDPMIAGLNIWTWDSWQYVKGYVGVNVGLKEFPKAIKAWTKIGKQIKAGRAAARGE